MRRTPLFRAERPKHGDYETDFRQHVAAVEAEAGERAKLEREVSSLRKSLSELEARIATLSGAVNAPRASASAGPSSFVGTVGATQGGTGQTSYAVGDILYASAANALSRLAIGTAAQILRVNSGATAPEWASLYVPVWTKYTVTHTDLDALSGSSDFTTLLTLPAKGVIHGVVIKHSTAFSGGTASAVVVSVGISGNATKYAPAFDVFQATGDTVFQISSVVGMESHGAGTVIRATFTVTGDTLANLTAGSVDVWVLSGVLP